MFHLLVRDDAFVSFLDVVLEAPARGILGQFRCLGVVPLAERFDAATAAALVARPVVLAAASEERLDAPAFLSVASFRICDISPLTAGVTLRHHEVPLSLPER